MNATGSVSVVGSGTATIQATDAGISGSATLTASGVTPSGNLSVSRDSHTATLLNDGEVLVAGGAVVSATGASITGALELYSNGVFNVLYNAMTPRYNHTATLLDDGTVLLAGGSSSVGSPETGLVSPKSTLRPTFPVHICRTPSPHCRK